MTTGQLIRNARKAAGLTQKELGEKLGVSGSMIGQYETGIRVPKRDTICRISGALDISPYKLYGDDTLSDSSIDFVIDATTAFKLLQVFRDDNSFPLHAKKAIDKTFPNLNDMLEQAARYTFSLLSAVNSLDTPEMQTISRLLPMLNDDGREAAVSRVEELTEIPRYRSTDKPDSE